MLASEETAHPSKVTGPRARTPSEKTILLPRFFQPLEEGKAVSKNVRKAKDLFLLVAALVVGSLALAHALCLLPASRQDRSQKDGWQQHQLERQILDLEERYEKWEHDLQARATDHYPLAQIRQQLLLPPRRPKESLDPLIYFNESKAFQMLQPNDHFYHYQQGWEAQITQSYCGVASSAAVLNSYRGHHMFLPVDPVYRPYAWATQRRILMQKCVIDNITHDYRDQNGTYFIPYLPAGLGLPMARQLLECHLNQQNYTVQQYIMDPFRDSVESMREILQKALSDDTARVMINYDRGGLGQGPMGHGHFSPIGAYNHDLDSFLILDVAKYKYPPVWVSASNLFRGMSTLDMCSDFEYPPDLLSYPTLSEFMFHCHANFRGFLMVKPMEEDVQIEDY